MLIPRLRAGADLELWKRYQKHGHGHVCDDHALGRIVWGNSNDVKNSLENVLVHLRWRVAYKLDDIVAEDFSDLDSSGCIRWHKPAKLGQPPAFRIVFARTPKCRDKESRKRTARFAIYMLERGKRHFRSLHNFMYAAAA